MELWTIHLQKYLKNGGMHLNCTLGDLKYRSRKNRMYLCSFTTLDTSQKYNKAIIIKDVK